MYRTEFLYIIRSLDTAFTATGICHTSYVDCLLADGQHNYQTVAENTVSRPLMMDSKSVRNMESCMSKFS